MDIASSIQAALEEIILKLTRSLAVEFKINNLCLAGGVALNCVANGKIAKDGAFNNVWLQPAAGAGATSRWCWPRQSPHLRPWASARPGVQAP